MLNLFRPKYERGVPQEYCRFLLKNRITPEQYAAQQQISTAEWNLDPNDVPKFKSAIDAVVFKRHDNAVRYLAPWIEHVTSLKGAHVLEIGPGCGSSTLAMSHFAEHVDAIDIDANQLAASQQRMSLFGADNVALHHTTADQMTQCALDHLRANSIILLVGVVEHMTEAEQIDFFSRLWQALVPGQIIVIAETPNYYAWFDAHTFMAPFASMVPDALFPQFVKERSPDLRFSDHLLHVEQNEGTEAMLRRRRRLGLGVTHHVFEQACGHDLNHIVVADGFENPMLKWSPIEADDRLLVTAFRVHNIDLPVAFARGMMSFILRKPSSPDEIRKIVNRNCQRRKSVLRKYGARLSWI